MSPHNRTVAIAGAGIAGLTAGLLLGELGYKISIFEKASEPFPSGTGIQLSPNAFKILAQSGLEKALLATAFTPQSVDITSGQSGALLTKFELGSAIRERHGAPYIVLHRADLSNILKTACEQNPNIELIYSQTVVDFRKENGDTTLLAEVADKQIEHRQHAVIGADGVWSTLRKFVTGAAQPKFTGNIAWRSVVEMKSVPEVFPQNSTGLWIGPGAHLVHYPLRQNSVMNIVAITPWGKSAPPPPGWLAENRSAERGDFFKNWYPEIQNLIAEKAEWGGWPVFAVPKVGALANGPLCLIGDAGHAMVPYGAQGGASAIEDAAVLAQCCTEFPSDLPKAFLRFEELRHSRLQKIIALSNNNRRIYHLSSPFSGVRDLVMKRSPQAMLQKRMDWLYGWTAED